MCPFSELQYTQCNLLHSNQRLLAAPAACLLVCAVLAKLFVHHVSLVVMLALQLHRFPYKRTLGLFS